MKYYRFSVSGEEGKFPLDVEVEQRVALIRKTEPELFDASTVSIHEKLDNLKLQVKALGMAGRPRLPRPLIEDFAAGPGWVDLVNYDKKL